MFKRLQFAGILPDKILHSLPGSGKLSYAAIVREIVALYAAGEAPRGIAFRLDAPGAFRPLVAALGARQHAERQPRAARTTTRGTGVLKDEMYIGRLVWNRLSYAKDPETGKRRARMRAMPPSRSKRRSLRLSRASFGTRSRGDKRASTRGQRPKKRARGSSGAPLPFWSKRRLRYLFSDLMRCGVCGGGFSKVSKAHFGCSTARNKARRDRVQSSPDDPMRSARGDGDERAARPANGFGPVQAHRGVYRGMESAAGRGRSNVTRVSAVRSTGWSTRWPTENQRRPSVSWRPAVAPPLRLHPNIAEVYRRKVEELHGAEDAGPARELIRGLIEAIVLIPEDGPLQVEVRGELAAILRLSGLANGKAPAGGPELLAEQVKLVAGAGFEPAAFRL